MKYIWDDSLRINEAALSLYLYRELKKPDKIIVHFGALQKTFNVVVKENLSDKTVGLPVPLTDKYTIPADIPYEIYDKGGEIYLGPVIAYVLKKPFANLNKRLSRHLPRFWEYESIKGLIFACSTDSINPEKNLIEGYYYSPKKLYNPWKYGRFPLPDAVFVQAVMDKNAVKALEQKIGKKIFNSSWRNLNKLNIWKKLSEDKSLIEHLPYTEKYNGIKQLKRFLPKYQSVYLKPFSKSRGRGILSVSKSNHTIVVRDEWIQSYKFKDYNSLNYFFKTRLAQDMIIQQAVPFTWKNKMVDFRIILQKDKDKKWSFLGSVAKISLPGSPITNKKSRESLLEGEKALTTIFNLSEKKANNIIREMIELTVRAINLYERDGMHLGDVAADIILDSNLHLWLLELQLNHRISEQNPKLFNRVMTTPFRYAKSLAGFS